jgi:HEAT repeat protein
MKMKRPRLIVLAVLTVGVVARPSATADPSTPQRPGAVRVEEATAITQAWGLLAQGLVEQAAATAEAALTRYPRNPAALSVAIEAWIARDGALPALDRYEAWSGQLRIEPAHELRRIARAVLWEVAERADGAGRIEALRALVADGDGEAATALSRGLEAGRMTDLLAMAALGSDVAVTKLIESLEPKGSHARALSALGESRQPIAAPSVRPFLSDIRTENRVAAAKALGLLNQYEDRDRIAQLLDESEEFPVRVAAAEALQSMGDARGRVVLDAMLASEHPMIRLHAAQALKGDRSPDWQRVTHGLLAASDPSIRVEAALLLAGSEPEVVRPVWQGGLNEANESIRELAERVWVVSSAQDIPQLRQILRKAGQSGRVAAAQAILELTR